MNPKTKNPSEEPVPTELVSETRNAPAVQDPEDRFFDRLPYPCVYCGPSVRGVARQFTVYSKGVPDALKTFTKQHPAAKGLLVSVSAFAAMRARLETPGTAESILFQKIRSELG